MKICVYGAGAVGGLIAAWLARSGHEVSVIARGAHLEALDPGGKLEHAMPTERIVGCVIHLAASTPEPGLISHNMGRKLILGEPGGENTARTRRIAEALAAAGFEIVISSTIEKEFWVKLLGNVSFNP